MRKNEIEKFAQELYKLEKKHGVEVCSDNYFTRAVIVDVRKESGFSYHYSKGNIELDSNTYMKDENIE